MADQYKNFQINGVSLSQYRAFSPLYDTFDKTGSDVSSIEYNPTTQVVQISFGGADLTALVARLQTFLQAQIGRPPDVSQGIAPGVKCKTKADIARGL